MKIIFLGIGKTKHKFLTEGINRYKKLLLNSVSLEEKYLKEEDESRPESIEKETAVLIKNIPGGFHRVLLDVKGERFSSEKFSAYLKDLRDRSSKGIAFIIGGSNGVGNELKETADLRLSFSDFTMTHQMVRLFLAEQLYRAFSIINNKKYHK